MTDFHYLTTEFQKQAIDKLRAANRLTPEMEQKLSRPITVELGKRTRAAGMAWHLSWKVAYNDSMLLANGIDAVYRTVAHEVAHLIADAYFGFRCKHGKEWKWVMETLMGQPSTRCHDYDMDGHVKRTRSKATRYAVSCMQCSKEYQVTAIRLKRGLHRYRCKCGGCLK